ncbi:MAG: hypothetical protein H0T42_02930 [Deltaproteobacteria bacterium]|nr:hypothetical protein [Deltaproteobacteria bacterium]
MIRLLALSFALLACSKQANPANDPVDLKNDGWSCYSYIGDRTHCELRMDFCNQTREKIPPEYKPDECVRVDVVWCYERPGDDPVESSAGDPAMIEETIRRWCYRSPEECAAHDPECVKLP